MIKPSLFKSKLGLLIVPILILALVVVSYFIYINFFTLKLSDKKLNILLSPFRKQSEQTIDKISLAKIFNKDHSWIKKYSQEHLITLIATGDVIPARSVNFKTLSYNNFNWAFEKTADFLKSADITLINLESPLVPSCSLTNEGMVFCGDQKHIEGLLFAGIDVVNLANNHSSNYGYEGIQKTVNLLSNKNIISTGVSNISYKNIKGINFAFLGYNLIFGSVPPVSWADEELIKMQISEARKNSDVVVVSFHWGDEYTDFPNQRQKDLAHFTIDSGADLIIGNHPHWIQPVEIYKEKLIVYAHGNFIFDQMWSEKTKEGIVGKYTFYKNKLIDAEFSPVFIQDYGQPHFLEGKEKEIILDELQKLSLEISH